MKDKFRVVVPELAVIPSGAIPDVMINTKVSTVLWRGEAFPNQEICEALMEGQIYNRSQSRQIAGAESAFAPIGEELLVQKQRRVPLMGWKTVNVIPVG